MALKQSSTNVKRKGKQDSGKVEALIEYEKIEGTLFTIVTREQKTHFITIGNNRVSEETNDKEKLKKMITDKDWGLIGGMIATMTLAIMKEQEQKQTGIK